MKVATAWSERCRQLSEPVVEACSVVPVTAGPGGLAREIARHLPDWPFREVLCRGGWYRVGGVVAADGRRVSDRIEQWAAHELDARDGDLSHLLEDLAESDLRATHFTGRTHYFAAARGGGSTDFLQLEIEELQEVWAQPLFREGAVPGTLDELIDARCDDCSGCRAGEGSRCGAPIDAAHFRFRRLTHIGDVLARMRAQSLDPLPVHRFVADWDASSAAGATGFCKHWAVALREHLDRFSQTVVSATPIAAPAADAPRFGAREGTSGLSLHGALLAFDRGAGYPMAWFFAMLTGKAVGHWVPAAVASDAAAGFFYLPERDLAVVRQWLHRPYAF